MELGLDGTNNAGEQVIGKSKVRYRTMCGYKSLDGMLNEIAVTQEIYRGALLIWTRNRSVTRRRTATEALRKITR